jgi:hypothetical protein
LNWGVLSQNTTLSIHPLQIQGLGYPLPEKNEILKNRVKKILLEYQFLNVLKEERIIKVESEYTETGLLTGNKHLSNAGDRYQFSYDSLQRLKQTEYGIGGSNHIEFTDFEYNKSGELRKKYFKTNTSEGGSAQFGETEISTHLNSQNQIEYEIHHSLYFKSYYLADFQGVEKIFIPKKFIEESLNLVLFAYNEVGKIKKLSFFEMKNNKSVKIKEISYNYLKNNQLHQVIEIDSINNQTQIDYKYNTKGLIISTIQEYKPSDNPRQTNQIQTLFNYNSNDLLENYEEIIMMWDKKSQSYLTHKNTGKYQYEYYPPANNVVKKNKNPKNPKKN